MAKIAAIQMCSSDDVKQNLQTVARLLQQTQADIVVLPEMFAIAGNNPGDKLLVKEKYGEGSIQDFLAEQARTHGIWIVGGTIPLTSEDPNRAKAACLIYNNHGQVVARYDKIHLFDVTVSGSEIYNESHTIAAGDSIIVIDSPVGKLGVAVCYDIRFPELFRQMSERGAEVLVIPTAFTVTTGQAHWEVLTRCRAIENFCYLVAACQSGTHSNGRTTYGHSVIIDPFGKIIRELPTQEGSIIADIDLEYVKQVRINMPSLDNRKIYCS